MAAPSRITAAASARFPAFGSVDYRRLFFAAVFQNVANWALMMARGWLVFDLTGSSAAVGVVTFGGMVPFLFTAPIAGALADRYDRRRLAVGAAAGNMVTSLALAALTFAGIVAVWHIALLAVLHGVARSVQVPAEQAMLPNLVPRPHLLSAVSLHSISMHGSRLLGPLMGAVVMGVLGPAEVFLLAGALLVGSLASVARIGYRREPTEGGVVAGGMLQDLAAGVRYTWADPRLRLVLGLVVFHCTLTMAFDSMMPRLATEAGGGERTFSAILAALGAGAVAGTLLVAGLPESKQGLALAVTGVGSGLAMLGMGGGQQPWSVVAGAALAGGMQAGYMTLSAALIQGATVDAMRARVMSLFLMLALGHMSFMNLGFGAWADSVGVRPLLIVPGLLWVAVFLGAPLLTGELRHLLRSGAFRPPAQPAAPSAPADAAS